MAQQLVESLASDKFDASKYHDEYREQLLDLIERKAAGEEIVAEPEVEAPAKVLDLVAALEASLAKAATAKDRHPSTSGRKVDVEDDEDEDDDEDEAGAPPLREGATAKATRATKTRQEGAGQEGAREEALGLGRRIRRGMLLAEPPALDADHVVGAVAAEADTRLPAAVRDAQGLERQRFGGCHGATMTGG